MKPRRVILCVDRFDAPEGKIWSVRVGRRWLNAHTVHCWIDLETVFRGAHARQPKAYLQGFGIVREDGHGTITIAES